MVKKIPLGSRKYPGHYALVDDEDYEYLKNYNWFLLAMHRTNNKWKNYDYARNVKKGQMHRFICSVSMGSDFDNCNGYKPAAVRE